MNFSQKSTLTKWHFFGIMNLLILNFLYMRKFLRELAFGAGLAVAGAGATEAKHQIDEHAEVQKGNKEEIKAGQIYNELTELLDLIDREQNKVNKERESDPGFNKEMSRILRVENSEEKLVGIVGSYDKWKDTPHKLGILAKLDAIIPIGYDQGKNDEVVHLRDQLNSILNSLSDDETNLKADIGS